MAASHVQGIVPPFVSQSTTCDAPARAAATATATAKEAFALCPSKKCSQSTMTSLPCFRKNATDSVTIARFSSASTPRTFSHCSSHALATTQTHGAGHSTSALRPSSFSAATPRLRVMPNAASVTFLASARSASPLENQRWKNSTSLGLEPG